MAASPEFLKVGGFRVGGLFRVGFIGFRNGILVLRGCLGLA